MLSYSITTVIVTLTFQFLEIGKANYRALNINQNNLEESFSNFKAVYAITYVTIALFVVVYCILSEFLLSKFTACSVDIIKILFDIECGFLLFGIIPLIFIAPTYKTSFLILIVLNVIFVAKDFLNFQATVLMLVIYAILIPLVTFSSVKLMLTSIKQRIGQGFGLYDKLDKSYRIYTGKPLSFLIKMYCLMNVLLFLIRLLLSNDDNFTTITNSTITAKTPWFTVVAKLTNPSWIAFNTCASAIYSIITNRILRTMANTFFITLWAIIAWFTFIT